MRLSAPLKTTRSSPEPAATTSAPPLPSIVSAPAPVESVFAPVLPVMLAFCAALRPLPSMLANPLTTVPSPVVWSVALDRLKVPPTLSCRVPLAPDVVIEVSEP